MKFHELFRDVIRADRVLQSQVELVLFEQGLAAAVVAGQTLERAASSVDVDGDVLGQFGHVIFPLTVRRAMRVEPGNFLASILQFGKRLFLDHQRSLRRQNARRKVDRQLRRHLVRFESDGSVRIGHVNVRIAAMGHGPVEVVRILDDVGRKAFADARNRRVRNRFVQEEDETLMRKSVLGEILQLVLQGVEDDCVTLVEQTAITGHPTVGYRAVVLCKRLLTVTDRKVFSFIVRSPK